MYILMLSRGIPSKYHPQWGCFEKDQAEALAAYGHKVVVISVDTRFRRHRGHLGLHHIVDNGVEYYNYVMLPIVLLRKIVGLNWYNKKVRFPYFDRMYQQVIADHGKPDILYTQYYFITIYGALLKQKYNYSIPLVGIEHFSEFNNPILSKEVEKWATFAFQGVDKLICVSKSLANNIEKRFGIKSIVVNNTIGNDFLCDIPPTKYKETFVFVAMGSLIKRKGFDILLEAFAQSGLQTQNCVIKIIGNGPERRSLEVQIQRLGIEKQVELLGKKNKNEIVKILSESNVFVLSSRSETFGVVCIESLAMGLPNIATTCGGPEEFITTQNGKLVSPENIGELSSAMQMMYKNYSSYNQLMIAEDCRKRFSPMAIAEQLTGIFEDTIKNVKN